MEEAEYASFLRKDMLIITTGMGKSSPSWLSDFIRNLIAADCSGLIINIGKYLRKDDVSDDIIRLCDEKGFPLFIMPWKIRLIDISQAFLSSIFQAQYRETEIINACKMLIWNQDVNEAINRLKLQNLSEQNLFQVLTFSFEKNHTPKEKRNLLMRCKFFLNELSIPYIIIPKFPQKNFLCTIWQISSKRESDAVLEKFMEKWTAHRLSPLIAGSGTLRTLRELSVSYRQSVYALIWAKMDKKKQLYFGDLGIYALLFSQNDVQVLKEIHDKALSSLLNYDKKHDCQLFLTLESYLRHGGSIQAISQETFVHRNTATYRLSKIKKLLDCDLKDSNARFTYSLACYIHHYLQVIEGNSDLL